MMKVLKALLYVPFLMILAAGSSFACSCIRSSVEENFQGADAVFLGKVVEVGGYWDDWGARLKVEKSWKGVGVDEVTVYTVSNTCAFSFEEGETYVIFGGFSPEGKLGTTACSNSTNVKYDRAGETLSHLANKDTITLAPVPVRYWGIGFITALCVSLFIVIGVLMKKCFRRAA